MNDLSDNYKDDFADIDALLLQAASPRTAQTGGHDLAERIIHRAARTPQTRTPQTQAKPGALGNFFGEMLALITVPRPALALGLCLMIGMFSGWAASHNVEANDTAYGYNNDEGTLYQNTLNPVVIEEEWL